MLDLIINLSLRISTRFSSRAEADRMIGETIHGISRNRPGQTQKAFQVALRHATPREVIPTDS